MHTFERGSSWLNLAWERRRVGAKLDWLRLGNEWRTYDMVYYTDKLLGTLTEVKSLSTLWAIRSSYGSSGSWLTLPSQTQTKHVYQECQRCDRKLTESFAHGTILKLILSLHFGHQIELRNRGSSILYKSCTILDYTFRPKSLFFVPDNATRHRNPEECGSLLRQRQNTKSWSAIIKWYCTESYRSYQVIIIIKST